MSNTLAELPALQAGLEQGASRQRAVGLPPTLSVSIVTYHQDEAVLRRTLESLVASFDHARAAELLHELQVVVVDNGTDSPQSLDDTVRAACADHERVRWAIRRGHGNVGYGRGHNLVLLESPATYHLVLNPDVVVERNALGSAVRFMEASRDVGMIAPHVSGDDGERQYLCREYPTIAVLFLRGFAPRWLTRTCRGYMQNHELRRRTESSVERRIPLISGCFMFARAVALRQVNGFAPEYFMYFEDSELSLAVGRTWDVAYVPDVRIMHFGGGASRKGWRHTLMFCRSAFRFFSRNGWRLV